MVGQKGVRITATRNRLRVEAQGYSGQACEGLLNQILQDLGIDPNEAQPLETYWQQEPEERQELMKKPGS